MSSCPCPCPISPQQFLVHRESGLFFFQLKEFIEKNDFGGKFENYSWTTTSNIIREQVQNCQMSCFWKDSQLFSSRECRIWIWNNWVIHIIMCNMHENLIFELISTEFVYGGRISTEFFMEYFSGKSNFLSANMKKMSMYGVM